MGFFVAKNTFYVIDQWFETRSILCSPIFILAGLCWWTFVGWWSKKQLGKFIFKLTYLPQIFSAITNTLWDLWLEGAHACWFMICLNVEFNCQIRSTVSGQPNWGVKSPTQACALPPYALFFISHFWSTKLYVPGIPLNKNVPLIYTVWASTVV